jgi:hypothetical protein
MQSSSLLAQVALLKFIGAPPQQKSRLDLSKNTVLLRRHDDERRQLLHGMQRWHSRTLLLRL